MVKILPAVWERNALERESTTHSRILALAKPMDRSLADMTERLTLTWSRLRLGMLLNILQ